LKAEVIERLFHFSFKCNENKFRIASWDRLRTESDRGAAFGPPVAHDTYLAVLNKEANRRIEIGDGSVKWVQRMRQTLAGVRVHDLPALTLSAITSLPCALRLAFWRCSRRRPPPKLK
jgi:hypothetical protein